LVSFNQLDLIIWKYTKKFIWKNSRKLSFF